MRFLFWLALITSSLIWICWGLKQFLTGAGFSRVGTLQEKIKLVSWVWLIYVWRKPWIIAWVESNHINFNTTFSPKISIHWLYGVPHLIYQQSLLVLDFERSLKIKLLRTITQVVFTLYLHLKPKSMRFMDHLTNISTSTFNLV